MTGTPTKEGSVWAWEGKEVGKGSMILQEAKENESLKTKLIFTAPMENDAMCDWKFEPSTAGAKVIWSFEMIRPTIRWEGILD